MKSKIEVDKEVILTSKYCQILEAILSKHQDISVIKAAIFSFLYKKQLFKDSIPFRTTSNKDISLKAISLLSGNYNSFLIDLPYIFESIDILYQANIIEVQSDLLISNRKYNHYFNTNDFIDLAIYESKALSDRQFLKEVVSSV